MDNGWFIPDESMSAMAMEIFMKMMNTICHGGMVNVSARVDGKEYHWQCDGLKYATRINNPRRKTMTAETEMPRYKCHKEVWALKIASIKRDGEGEDRESDGSGIITPEDAGYAPFKVDHQFMHKHKPQVGGYYVVYKDGYKSFSPAEAFDDGYSKVA